MPYGLPNDPLTISPWTFTRWTLGVALVHRQTAAERDPGQKLLAEVGEEYLRRRQNLCDLPIVNMYLAREIARRGDRDEALPLMRAAVDHLFRDGKVLRGAFQRPVFWWRHCSTAAPTVTWPKPRPRSSG